MKCLFLFSHLNLTGECGFLCQSSDTGVTLLGCLWCPLQVWPWRTHCDIWGCSWYGLNPTQPFPVQINPVWSALDFIGHPQCGFWSRFGLVGATLEKFQPFPSPKLSCRWVVRTRICHIRHLQHQQQWHFHGTAGKSWGIRRRNLLLPAGSQIAECSG